MPPALGKAVCSHWPRTAQQINNDATDMKISKTRQQLKYRRRAALVSIVEVIIARKQIIRRMRYGAGQSSLCMYSLGLGSNTILDVTHEKALKSSLFLKFWSPAYSTVSWTVLGSGDVRRQLSCSSIALTTTHIFIIRQSFELCCRGLCRACTATKRLEL
jgi:hypothetical protein